MYTPKINAFITCPRSLETTAPNLISLGLIFSIVTNPYERVKRSSDRGGNARDRYFSDNGVPIGTGKSLVAQPRKYGRKYVSLPTLGMIRYRS